MRHALILAALMCGACTNVEAKVRPITILPDYAEGVVSAFGEPIRVSEGVAFAFDCETSGGAVCYGLEARANDPNIVLVERMYLDSDVIREVEIDADRLPTGDSRVFLMVGLSAGSTTLVLDHDEGTSEIPIEVLPR